MTWNLFIDDERDPPNDGREWVVARDQFNALMEIFVRGMPKYISFDHDLGENKYTGYDIVKEIVEIDMNNSDSKYNFSENFDFYVHSQNPVGKANIEGLLNGYFKAKERSKQVPSNQHRFDEIATISEQDYEGDITVGKVKK